jgi:hypothetical protein
MILVVAAVAAAEPGTSMRHAVAGHPVLELRGGLAASPAATGGVLCAEVSPVAPVAVDACGTGGGFLTPDAGSEMMHLRVEMNVGLYEGHRTDLTLQPGLGMAEIQRGADEPGFRFGPASSPSQRDGAGLDAAASLKGRVWPTGGVYVSAEVSVGAGWIQAAPVVLGGGGTVVPYALGTVGLGF